MSGCQVFLVFLDNGSERLPYIEVFLVDSNSRVGRYTYVTSRIKPFKEDIFEMRKLDFIFKKNQVWGTIVLSHELPEKCRLYRRETSKKGRKEKN